MEIPQDIIDNVIAAIGNDKQSLKQCALVSSSFLFPCRKQLFSEIYLDVHNDHRMLYQLLVKNPVLQSFVRKIAICWHKTEVLSIVAILRLSFYRLESFSLTSHTWKVVNWNTLSREFQDALSNTIHLSTLKFLYLSEVADVPISLFDVVHLTELKLHSISLNYVDVQQSGSLATMASHTAIDRCIWYINGVHSTRFSTSAYFSPIQGIDGPTEPIFLPFMCRLRFFEIDIDPHSATMSDFDILSFLMSSLCVSLTSPAVLEHLKFKIWFRAGDNFFNYYSLFRDLRDADVWSHLDSIVTHPNGSQLQRVDIVINYAFRYDDDVVEPDNDEILEAIRDALPLLCEKGILFVEAFVGK
jgi:hypothetical protein